MIDDKQRIFELTVGEFKTVIKELIQMELNTMKMDLEQKNGLQSSIESHKMYGTRYVAKALGCSEKVLRQRCKDRIWPHANSGTPNKARYRFTQAHIKQIQETGVTKV